MTSFTTIERDFYRTLNGFIEPLVRAGAGSPVLTPTGLIVLETIGRSSGEPRRTPLVATLVGRFVVVGTLRGSRSQWTRNAEAHPAVRYWIGGVEHAGVAAIIRGGASASGALVPAEIRGFVDAVLTPATLLGWTFAIVEPAPDVNA